MKLTITIVAALALALTATALASEQPSRFVSSISNIDESIVPPDFIDRKPQPIDPASLRQESDVNHDGIVDVNDLLIVISHWGLCPAWSELTCEGDIDSSFTVDTNDLTAVIANWGEAVPVE
jgi:hypothetical protein